MASRRPASAALTGTTSASVYCYNVASASAIFSSSTSYNKGAWALHTLRKYVGDVKFFQILANYRATYQGSAATTQQFVDIASAVYGSSLQGYFDSFVVGQGAPVYSYATQAVTINGKTYLKLNVKQTQNTLMGKTGELQAPDIRTSGACYLQTTISANANLIVIQIVIAILKDKFQSYSASVPSRRSSLHYPHSDPQSRARNTHQIG